MPLIHPRFTVWLNPLDDGEPTEHTITVNHQDQLRAELELSRQGVRSNLAPLTMTTAWCWASLTRAGHYSGPWDRFRDFDCAGVEDAGEETVDPTQRTTGADSRSHSPDSGPAPAPTTG